MSGIDQAAEPAAQKVNVDGRGGKREACGYLCASVGRGPNAINPSFYVVAILALAYLDARCFDAANPNYDGVKWL